MGSASVVFTDPASQMIGTIEGLNITRATRVMSEGADGLVDPAAPVAELPATADARRLLDIANDPATAAQYTHTEPASSRSLSDPAAPASVGQTEATSILLDLSFPMPRWLSISFTFGLMICVLVFSTGSISGGNINPAVTISLMITQKMSTFRASCYVVAQCIGAVVGSAFVKSLAPALFTAAGGAANAINTASPFVTTWTAIGGEFLGTGLLVFTVCAAADVGREKGNKYTGAMTPLMLGFAVLCAHLFLIPIDGCSINPARSFGSAVVQGSFKDHWVVSCEVQCRAGGRRRRSLVLSSPPHC
jgi:MIP family channel proteins